MAKSETPRRHTSGSKNGNGNGVTNGRGKGAAAPAAAATTTRARSGAEEVLEGQPPISELLQRSGGRMRPSAEGGLQKSKLLEALLAFKRGDFRARLSVDLEGTDGKIADAFNECITLNERMAEELERLSRVVGKEG
ncbi:MAG: hypothetical protein QOE14_366, partial [Humisphaera sp.]|nr:hypothetical protein [Humisphaera sp.]